MMARGAFQTHTTISPDSEFAHTDHALFLSLLHALTLTATALLLASRLAGHTGTTNSLGRRGLLQGTTAAELKARLEGPAEGGALLLLGELWGITVAILICLALGLLAVLVEPSPVRHMLISINAFLFVDGLVCALAAAY